MDRFWRQGGCRFGFFSSRKLNQSHHERGWNIRSTGTRRRLLVDPWWTLAVGEASKVEFGGLLLHATGGARMANLGRGRSHVEEHKAQEAEDVLKDPSFHS